jgi:hypothetical protein
VFSSCGSLGGLFDGILHAIESHAPNMLRKLSGVAGTSGGAVTALAVALGLNNHKRQRIVELVTDWSNVNRPDLSTLSRTYGLDDGRNLRAVVEELLDLGGLSKQTTLRDLERLLRMDVVFVAHDLARGEAVHLRASNYPDMPVAEAVVASCAIPILFAPVRYGDALLCDGVLSEHVPNVFPEDETMHVVTPLPDKEHITSWQDYVHALFLATYVPQKPRIAAMKNVLLADHHNISGLRCIEPTMDHKLMKRVQLCGFSVGIFHIFQAEMSTIFRGVLAAVLTCAKSSRECEFEIEES